MSGLEWFGDCNWDIACFLFVCGDGRVRVLSVERKGRVYWVFQSVCGVGGG